MPRGATAARLDDYQEAFTRAFTRHYYDARTDAAADALAQVYMRLDRCKSRSSWPTRRWATWSACTTRRNPATGQHADGGVSPCATLMAAGGKERTAGGDPEAAGQVVQESRS